MSYGFNLWRPPSAIRRPPFFICLTLSLILISGCTSILSPPTRSSHDHRTDNQAGNNSETAAQVFRAVNVVLARESADRATRGEALRILKAHLDTEEYHDNRRHRNE